MADPSTLGPGNGVERETRVQIYVFHHNGAPLERALKGRAISSFGPNFSFINLDELPLPSEAIIPGVEPALNRAMLSEYLGILSVNPPDDAEMVGTFTYSIPLKFSVGWAMETGNDNLFLPELDFTAIEALLTKLEPTKIYGVEFKHPLRDDKGPVQQLAKQQGGISPHAKGPYKGSLICSRERFLALQSYLRQTTPTILSVNETTLEGVNNPFSAGTLAGRTEERASLDQRRSTYGNALERAVALFFSGEDDQRRQVRLVHLSRGLKVRSCPVLKEVHRAAVAGVAVVTFCNMEYLPVLERWLKHAREAEIRGLVVVSFDQATTEFCTQEGVATVEAEIPFPSDLGELWRYRLELTLRIIETGLSVLLSDIDAYWLDNPMPRLQAGKAHIVASQGTFYPRDVFKQSGIVLCCGFVYYRYSSQTLQCLKQLCEAASIDCDDQRVLNRWLQQQEIHWQIPHSLGRTSFNVEGSDQSFTAYDEDIEGITKGGLSVRLLAHRDFQRVLDESHRPIVSHLYVPKQSKAKLDAHSLLRMYPERHINHREEQTSTLIWLASYPRSGNTMLRTWLKHCFGLNSYSVYNDQNCIGRDPGMRKVTGHQDREWFYGNGGRFMSLTPDDYEGFNSDRRRTSGISVIKSHGQWNAGYEKDPQIYMYRDGRAALTSHAHYRLKFANLPSTSHQPEEQQRASFRREIEELIICGRPQCGYWSDNVVSWLDNAHSPNSLILSFEEAVDNPHSILIKLEKFLGRPLLSDQPPEFRQLQSTNSSFFRKGVTETPEFDDIFLQALFFAFEWTGMLKAGYISDYTSPWDSAAIALSANPANQDPRLVLSIIRYLRLCIASHTTEVHRANLASFKEKVADISHRCIQHLANNTSISPEYKQEVHTWRALKQDVEDFAPFQQHIATASQNHMRESIYFYTLHKCGSTLVTRRILKEVEGFQHIDYASKIYSGSSEQLDQTLTFEQHGHLYGPLRISAREGPVAKLLIEPTTSKDFLKDKQAVFMIRDPRDIIVSSYYSFGFSHPLSPVEEIRTRQLQGRSKISGKSLDEYARNQSLIKIHKKNFATICRLALSCPKSVVLRYEDMIDNFDKFIASLTSVLPLSAIAQERLFQESRPRAKEDATSHKRSGSTEGFRHKLTQETIDFLNIEMVDILETFGYRP